MVNHTPARSPSLMIIFLVGIAARSVAIRWRVTHPARRFRFGFQVPSFQRKHGAEGIVISPQVIIGLVPALIHQTDARPAKGERENMRAAPVGHLGIHKNVGPIF